MLLELFLIVSTKLSIKVILRLIDLSKKVDLRSQEFWRTYSRGESTFSEPIDYFQFCLTHQKKRPGRVSLIAGDSIQQLSYNKYRPNHLIFSDQGTIDRSSGMIRPFEEKFIDVIPTTMGQGFVSEISIYLPDNN